MKKLTSEQMIGVEGGQVQVTLVSQSFADSIYGMGAYDGKISPLHYTWKDCIGFVGGFVGMLGAAFGTGGLGLIALGLVSFGGFVAAAGNCEGYLNS